ncbi:MAG: polysaccharide biosynthesis tyrosine autokinase, partial [Bacteroidaceae bacterium]
MNNENNIIEKREEDLDLISLLYIILRIVLKNWKWFVLSIVVCLGITVLYLMKQPRIYQRYTVMMTEDDGNSNGKFSSRMSRSNSGMSALMSLNGVSAGDNMQNEIYILQSYKLISKVVETLHLDETYTIQKGLRTDLLYKEKPFEIEFLSPYFKTVRFNVELLSNSRCRISNIKGIIGQESFTADYSLDTSVKTPVGNLVIRKNPKAFRFIGKTITVTRYNIENATASYIGAINASEVDKESSLIKITCSDTSIERADDILNTLLTLYKKNIIDGKNRIAENTERFVESRIKLIGDELSTVEGNLASFKRTNKIVNVEKAADAFITESSTNRQNILKLETQKSVLQYLKEYLKDTSKNSNDLIPMLGGMGDVSIQTQIAGYNELLLQRNRLIDNSSESNLVIKDMDRNLSSMRNAIRSSLQNCLSTTAVQLEQARGVEGGLSATMSEVPEKERNALDIARQQAIKEALYTYLLNKREEVAMQLSINEANVRIVEDPIGSRFPVSPRKSLVLLVGFIIGILLPSLIFWAKEMLQTVVRGRKDVEAATTIPIIGEIPQWENEKDTEIITGKSKHDYVIADAFRMVRYSINFMKKDTQVIMLTSTTPGQGKSFISRNLAAILGMADKRILLIDADIRKQTQSNILHRGKGLTSYLSEDETDMRKLITHNIIGENVDFMPAGIIPPNPAELLMSEKLETLITDLRQQYDYIVIDTTPAVLVADANIVNRVVDLTIYVIRVNIENRRFLPILEKFYQEKKFKNLCVLINGSVL